MLTNVGSINYFVLIYLQETQDENTNGPPQKKLRVDDEENNMDVDNESDDGSGDEEEKASDEAMVIRSKLYFLSFIITIFIAGSNGFVLFFSLRGF